MRRTLNPIRREGGLSLRRETIGNLRLRVLMIVRRELASRKAVIKGRRRSYWTARRMYAIAMFNRRLERSGGSNPLPPFLEQRNLLREADTLHQIRSWNIGLAGRS